MLYGHTIGEVVTVMPPAAGRAAVTVPVLGVQRPPLHLRAMTDKLKAANKRAHSTILYPNNYQALPDALANRVWAMIVERKQQSERRAQKHTYRLPGKYKAMSEDAAQEASKVVGPPLDYRSYYRCLGPVLGRHQTGNCGEYSALVVNTLLESVPQQRLRLLQGDLGEDNNHVCVVLDASDDADPADWRTYGRSAIVCDAWLDLVGLAGEYFRVLRVIDCDFRPDALRRLSERVG